MVDRWWRDETTVVWKKDPLHFATMTFRNGRKKNGCYSTRRRRIVGQFLLNLKKAYYLG